MVDQVYGAFQWLAWAKKIMQSYFNTKWRTSCTKHEHSTIGAWKNVMWQIILSAAPFSTPGTCLANSNTSNLASRKKRHLSTYEPGLLLGRILPWLICWGASFSWRLSLMCCYRPSIMPLFFNLPQAHREPDQRPRGLVHHLMIDLPWTSRDWRVWLETLSMTH